MPKKSYTLVPLREMSFFEVPRRGGGGGWAKRGRGNATKATLKTLTQSVKEGPDATTALRDAVDRHYPDIVQVLIDAGADIEKRTLMDVRLFFLRASEPCASTL